MCIDPPPARPQDPLSGSRGHAFNAPQRVMYPGLFRPLWRFMRVLSRTRVTSFWRSARSRPSGQTSPHSAASTGRRSGQFGTLLGATGGTQTHSRRTGWKLGRLRRARQELVRVSKSNTKYGGKRGITEAVPLL